MKWYIFIIIFVIELILLGFYWKFIINGKLSIYEQGKISDKSMIKRLISYMKPYIGKYILAIILMIIMVLLLTATPLLLSKSIKLIGEEDINIKKVLTFVILTIIFNIVANVIRYFQSLLLQKTGLDITYQIRCDVFRHIQSLSHHQFNEIPVGTLVTRATEDVNVLFELYTNVIVNLMKYVVTLLAIMGAMCMLNIRLTLVVLDVVPIIFALTLTFRTFARRVHREVRNKVSSMNAFLSENISGIKTTQIFNQEDKKYNEFKVANGELRKANLREIFTFSIFRPSIYLTYIGTIILVLYAGTNDAITTGFAGVITYDILYGFYEYIGRFFNPIQQLAEQYNVLQSAFAAGEKIFKVLDIIPEVQDEPDAIDIDIKGHIEFKNVWFSYVKDEWILRDVSFEVHPEDVIAFVGATGAGKSTILGLITRNYDIQKGEILIDGIPIKHIKINCIRRSIGQMLQDVFLFSGTIADNIRLEDESITDEEIIKACEKVNAMRFINKSNDGIYQTVSERGNNLSLGEKQLISFARVLVHKPKVMILDEATANIDTETEKIIQDSLEKVINENTMLMVAHRLSTIQHANNILVFDHGRIIEQGNHQELLKQKGRYYQLYMLQYQKNLYKNN